MTLNRAAASVLAAARGVLAALGVVKGWSTFHKTAPPARVTPPQTVAGAPGALALGVVHFVKPHQTVLYIASSRS